MSADDFKQDVQEVSGLGEDSEGSINLVSKDGVQFEVPLKDASISNLIKTSLEAGLHRFLFVFLCFLVTSRRVVFGIYRQKL